MNRPSPSSRSGPSTGSPVATSNRTLRWGWSLLALTGVVAILEGLGAAYRALTSDAFEPGVTALDGATAAELAANNPELASYVSHIQANGGFLAALLGVAIVALSWYGIRRGRRWALSTTVAVEGLYLAFLIPLHGLSAFEFHAVEHLAPVLVGLMLVVAGAALAYHGLSHVPDRETSATDRGGPP